MGRIRQDGEQTVQRRTFDAGLVQLTFEARLYDFSLILERVRDFRPFFAAIDAEGLMNNPDNFDRPDRMRGGVGAADKDGKRRNWGRGYQYRMGRTKRSATWRDRKNRPYGPRTTKAFETQLIERSLTYLVTGVP